MDFIPMLIPMGFWDPIVKFGSTIMQPLYWVVSGILVLLPHGVVAGLRRRQRLDLGAVHRLADRGHPDRADPAVRQADQVLAVMQLLQPQVRELQKKYGHDREKLGQETMKLYKDNNANPLASCLPLLLQMPIFFALFRVLDGRPSGIPRGHWLVMNPELARFAQQATIFGARLSDTFMKVGFANGITSVQCHARADHRDDGDAVHHPAAADAQEHAARGPDRAVRAAAEDHAVRVPADLRHRRHQFPGRRADLLVHLEPVDDGPAVLRDPPQPGAGTPAYDDWEARRKAKGKDPDGARQRGGGTRKRRRPPAAGTSTPRRWPGSSHDKQTRSQRKAEATQVQRQQLRAR